jgi:formylmethanofuran--tetrahydromethanopterin N-formyltransferase
LVDKSLIADIYAEAFSGLYCRIVVTAEESTTLTKAALDSTSTPAVVIGRLEGGVEKWLTDHETPDKRPGAILQFWGGIDPKKSFEEVLKKFNVELSYRIRQDILVKPHTAVFDALPNPEGKLDMMERVGHCGDGYEWIEERFGRDMIVVPIMVPDFTIQHYLGYARGVSGANFWIMCRTKDAVKNAGKNALDAIGQVNGVITPFGICSAGSKTETKFPWIGPTTNHLYCPSLRTKLGKASKVPENVNYIPEIVIDGVSMQVVTKAMRAGIVASLNTGGVVGISAGNYDGKLGEYKIHLRELFA